MRWYSLYGTNSVGGIGSCIGGGLRNCFSAEFKWTLGHVPVQWLQWRLPCNKYFGYAGGWGHLLNGENWRINSGGTVFRIGPTGKQTVLYDFCEQANGADGADPEGNLFVPQWTCTVWHHCWRRHEWRGCCISADSPGPTVRVEPVVRQGVGFVSCAVGAECFWHDRTVQPACTSPRKPTTSREQFAIIGKTGTGRK